MAETKYRICPFCEATCGLVLEVEGRAVRSIRGDAEDVFSRGFLCPKATALNDLDADPDRLREPLVRRGGRLMPVTWDEAFAEVEKRLLPIIEQHGSDAVGLYLGNPTVHNVGLTIYGQALARALRTRNLYSASTVDQIPKQLASGLMFGGFTTVAVPDIDRCDFLLILGANPFESNGSLWTVPDFPGRLRALQQRGGRCVVIDPRRTRTAQAADEHLFLRPGSDAWFLAALAHTLFADDLVRLGHLEPFTAGVAELRTALQGFTPEAAAVHCGIDAATLRRLARELAAAPHAAVYGRLGTCTQAFGTLASWLIDVCNVLTGNLDREGGVMFPLAAGFAANSHGMPGVGRGVRTGRRHSRVRGAPEVQGELPAVCLAEEIETPGEGQMRALFTVAGNPVLSTPDGPGLSRALAKLELMVSLDIYLNETTRHADVIFPGLSPLEQPHFDAIFPQFGYRNAARWSPAVFEPADRPFEWQTLLRLAAIAGGQGAHADVAMLDDFVAMSQVQRAVGDPTSSIHGRDPDAILQALQPQRGPQRGPQRIVDLALRSGPYGDGFGSDPEGLSIAKLTALPHGVDLGPLRPRLPGALRTSSGKIELAPDMLLQDLPRLRDVSLPGDALLLVGRRHLRSNNSWMHNLSGLAGGRPRCTLQIHPRDAQAHGLHDGGQARVSGRSGSIEALVEVTDAMMPGVVSLPHGWGHDEPETRLQVAARQPGVNSNRLADTSQLDPLSGNAVLNGIPVEIAAL